MISNIPCCHKKAVLLLLAVVSLVAVSKAQAPAAEEKNPSTKPPAAQPDAGKSAQNPNPLQEESRALQKIFELSPNDPKVLIKGLEDFLARFPQSARRGQILRTIYSQALQANDQRKAIETAEKLLELNPEDPDLLSALTDLYGRHTDAASRAKALTYATRFV